MGWSCRLLWLGRRRAWTAAALVGAGVAVGTMLLAVALGALHGWDAREARTGWRAAGTGGAEVVADRVAGRPMQLVMLADPRPGADPPPGLPRTPAPGEVFVSPALAQLLRELPADQLADRFPAAPTGTITDAGLRDPAELVAVVGRSGSMPDLGPAGWGLLETYRQLTYVAVALLAFPVVSLLGASARLTAARRVQRLATLRLLGASTSQVTVVAVTEVTAVATVAAVVGVAAQWLLAPALAAIELGGSGWFADDLRPTPAVLLSVVAGVAVLATASAAGGVRQVVIGPLQVVRRQRPGSARLVRLLALVAGVAVFAAANGLRQVGPRDVIGLIFGVGVLALFGVVSLTGPLVVRLIGHAMARSARSPARLLAGRRLLDDPRGAFRPVAGLTLAVFVAGFLAPLTAAVPGLAAADDVTLHLEAPPAAVSARLTASGITAQVQAEGDGTAVVTDVDRDRVRTVLAPLAPGVITEREADTETTTLFEDLTRGATVVLVGTFLLAATSAGTAAAARVLDQRRTLRLLRLTGTPLTVLDAARRAETVRPLAVNGGIALALGLLCASPFAAESEVLAPGPLLLLGGVLVAGVALVLTASAASRPLLRAVTTEVERED